MAMPLAWPEIAHTAEDVLQFCKMIARGSNYTQIDDLSRSLERGSTTNSCLFQISSSSLTDILNEIPMLGKQVFDMKLDEERKVNPQNPAKTVQISNNRVVYYESASINRGSCQCIFSFGGENKQERVRITYAANHSMPGLAIQQFFEKHFLQDTASSWYSRSGSFSTVIWVYLLMYV